VPDVHVVDDLHAEAAERVLRGRTRPISAGTTRTCSGVTFLPAVATVSSPRAHDDGAIVSSNKPVTEYWAVEEEQ
jgi:hypothetical protein